MIMISMKYTFITLATVLADFLVVDKSISAPGNEPRPKHGAIGGVVVMFPLPLCSWITSAADIACVFSSSRGNE